jgi:hypothetical protein
MRVFKTLQYIPLIFLLHMSSFLVKQERGSLKFVLKTNTFFTPTQKFAFVRFSLRSKSKFVVIRNIIILFLVIIYSFIYLK